MRRRLSDGEYRIAKEQERRAARAGQRADEARQAERRKNAESTTRTTAQGERIELFPKVDDLRHRVGAVRQALADAFDQAEQESGLQARMAQTHRADSKRFPGLGGQS